MSATVAGLPIVDVAPLCGSTAERQRVAQQLGDACRAYGFFYVVGHAVDGALQDRLERLARAFFAQPVAAKRAIAMTRGGRAWRGYFAPGEELTAGRPDAKEGIYFGRELPAEDPRVLAGTPLHGPNLFPDMPGFRDTVLAYLDAMTALGHRLLGGLSLSLGLEESYLRRHYTDDPLILFRIFNYPGVFPSATGEPAWGVGEHTDYGVLTILQQDDIGGLEVHSQGRFIPAPPIAGAFVCNLGDMLERMTGGRYRSTPHRVRNDSGRDRVSFPFFFDPGWDVTMRPLPGCEIPAVPPDARARWDRTDVHAFEGRYGDYVLGKIGKVFPELGLAVLRGAERDEAADRRNGSAAPPIDT